MKNPEPPSAAPVFPSAAKVTSKPKDPESLFGDLPRSRTAVVGALWSHQADQLRVYTEQHVGTPDVALELPTGSGKTIVGLLAGEWRRQALGQRVVYACPTRQLARQVALVGSQQGFAVRELVGEHAKWDAREVFDYTRADAMAVTTYSHVFNNWSKFADAKTLIFDDAHAAEGYVAEAWAVVIDRKDDIYMHLFDALADALDPQLIARLVGKGPDTSNPTEVRLIPLPFIEQKLVDIDAVLAAELTGDASWRFKMIRAHLGSCLFYVSRSGWCIRPMIPPTFDHQPFTAPEQRIYLSATLGDAGELERAFGRSPISRVPVPPAWERTGSGRRFFVFPDLADGSSKEDASSLMKRVVDLDPKRLILTPDATSAKKLASELEADPAEWFLATDEHGVGKFREADRGTLLAASRYDGMDLAGADCRVTVMEGLPGASHLQDRFLESKLRAGDVLAERIRTRIIQGVGRCTRGPQDWAVIVIRGEALLRYFSDRDHTRPMPIELQAEIEFGLLASRSSQDNVVALTNSALRQDKAWRENGEPALTEGRQAAVRNVPEIASELAASAAKEVKAWQSAWLGDWEEAGDRAVEVLEGLTGASTRPYRALWAYLASAWYGRSTSAGNAAGALRSIELLKKAHKAAAGSTWLREVAPLPAEFKMIEPADESAVHNILERLNQGALSSATKFAARASGMEIALAQAPSSAYEQALVELGHFLGAESWKPAGQGRTDAAWVWDELWITVEAKSEQTAELLSMDYVRKANTHLSSLEADRGVPAPEASVSVIVAPSRLVDPDAVPIANPNLYIAASEILVTLGYETHRAWSRLRSSLTGLGEAAAHDTAAKILWEHRLLPTQVRERLTEEPIRGG